MHEADPDRSRHRAIDGTRSTPESAVPAPSGTAPSGTAPSGTAPSGTAPSGTGGGAPDEVPFAPEADWVREQRSSLQYAAVGIQFGLTISLFALLGNWLDGRFGTSPWLLLVGVLLGFGGGTYSLLKKVSSSAR